MRKVRLWSREIRLNTITFHDLLFDEPKYENVHLAMLCLVHMSIPHFQEKQRNRPSQNVFYTVNFNSVLGKELLDKKFRSIPSLVFSGLVCLQETKWGATGANFC